MSKRTKKGKGKTKGRPGTPPRSLTPRSSLAESGSERRRWLYVLPVFAVALIIIYSPAWHGQFIWDDDQHLTENPCIVGPAGFTDIWTSSRATYYPLVLTTFWIVHQVAGLNPLPYHLLNVLFHGISAILLWRVLRELGVLAAWFGAALWAFHPVMVQSVAWVTELKNTQSSVFYLLSIFTFLKFDREEPGAPARRNWYVVSLIFFAMAITSKSSTVMLPVVLLLCLWWRERNLGAQAWMRVTPFFAISLVASAWTIWEQKFHSGAAGAEWSQSLWQRLALAGWDIWFYLGKLFWPVSLSFIYPQWQLDPARPVVFLPSALAALALGLLWWNRHGSARPLFFAAICFVVSLFPVLGFFSVYFFRYSFVSDHFQYLAAMPVLALVGAALATLVSRWRIHSSFARIASVTLLVFLGSLTFLQARDYRDPERLYQMIIRRNPEAWLAYSNLGAISQQEKKFGDAIDYFNKAVAIKPDATETQFSLGNAYRAEENFERAIPAYEAALAARPNNSRARNALAISLAATGRTTDAVAQFREAVRLTPMDPESQYNLGYALVQTGDRAEGIKHVAEALRLKPDYLQARRLLQAVEHAP